MLRDRLRTSAVLITICVVLMVLDTVVRVPRAEGIWLLPLMLFFSIGTAWEMATMLSEGGHPIRRMHAVIGTALISISAAVPFLWSLSDQGYPDDCPVGRLGWIVLATTAATFFVLLAEMRDYGKNADQSLGLAIRRTCTGAFVSVYVGVPMAMLTVIRGLNAEPSLGRFGVAALITTIIVTKVADAGAYFSGRALGRHKLIPRLSPGKTIEGAIGGVIASTLAAFLCFEYLFDALAADVTTVTTGAADTAGTNGIAGWISHPGVGAMILGPTLAVTGMVGDLAESLFKRDSGVKDSGTLLPGLGGVWDVTDSIIAASVPAFFCFAAGVGGA